MLMSLLGHVALALCFEGHQLVTSKFRTYRRGAVHLDEESDIGRGEEAVPASGES